MASTSYSKPSLLLFVLLAVFLLLTGNAHGLRLGSFVEQEKVSVSVSACPKTPVSQCDFYFESHLNKPPVISLDGAPDTATGPFLVDSHTGKKVQVGNTGIGSVICNRESKLSTTGSQFYFGGQNAQIYIRNFNERSKTDLENLCIRLPLLAVQTNVLNLNLNDEHQNMYPDSRRCVLLSTGPSGSCSSSPSPRPRAPPPPPTQPYFPSVFAFGDSTLDIGNNNALKTSTYKVNGFPWGIDYLPASGRFSNGKGVMDYVGELCRLTPINKFADLNATNFDKFKTGINFASGGSGAATSALCIQNTACTDFPTQILQFKNIRARYSKEKIAKSLFIFSTGSNDYYAYFANPSAYNVTQFVTNVVTALSGGIQALYQEGARKFLIVGLGEIDCTPSAFAFLNSSTSNPVCNLAINFLVQAHNKALQGALLQLSNAQAFFPGIKFVFGKAAELITDMHTNPTQYGFTNTISACCGGGIYNAVVQCGAVGSTYCPNRDAYLWWNRIHPTQKAWKIIADALFNGDASYVSPYGVKFLSTL